jgi:antitoxin (DNA-binding transcriptional repressor) of toxin-antitoxin stability system
MTINGHHIVMESVNIATLKAKLSQYLRMVRRGSTINVIDRNTQIAQIVPYQNDSEALPSRSPSRPLHSVSIPDALNRDLGSLEALLEERQNHR